MAFLRFSRDRRGYENTFLLHAARPGGDKNRPRLLYWFRTPPHLKVGRTPFDEDAIRLLEDEHPEVEFDWPRLLETPATASAGWNGEAENTPDGPQRPSESTVGAGAMLRRSAPRAVAAAVAAGADPTPDCAGLKPRLHNTQTTRAPPSSKVPRMGRIRAARGRSRYTSTMKTRIRWLVRGAAILALATNSLVAAQGQASSGGQQPAQAPPQPAKPQTQAPAIDESAKPQFRARVDLITTDVIVRDSTGQFVADLKKGDFEVFEDGVKQEIASVELVHGGRTYNLQAPPPPPQQEGIILPPTRPKNDAAGRIFLFFVDDLHMNFRDTPRIRQLFKKMSTMLVHEGDMFGIVSTGTSSIAIDMTYDRKRMDEAINKISGGALKPSEIIDAPQGAEGPSELRYRAHVAFSTAYDIVRNLEKVQNRRKAVIYVSNGYDFNPFEGARYADPNLVGMKNSNAQRMKDLGVEYDPFSRQQNEFADADLTRELSELTRAANRANATFYTIDPRGLVAGSDIDEEVDPTEWNNYLRKSQDSLRVIAEQTGGFATVNQNDFDKALKRIDAESSDYYVLGYYSSNPDVMKRTRRIEVKANRPNLDIWSRKSYSLKPPPEPKATK